MLVEDIDECGTECASSIYQTVNENIGAKAILE